ncbi:MULTISPECIES: class I SAM-dependent methyltransferase [Deefgea]|uniref:SAM-dependent methyltransferase n=1 Tax=Deefgea chitinilytica TaxID=570276 RepID=A0ABS2CF38_9NEIS|nr:MULTISPECIES: class I SAM-dependent methyltransferase [Deefgea]MBM5572001.1 SAM-dependent methyltransferase [Deefgea chitinilytica]MBM9889236.1 class I SAM-dependent methyltransferase [Deefgea sp. CFH1-16]
MSDLSSYRNRLTKNMRHWGKWARRQGLTCYRVYDRDVPEFPMIVDVYGDRVHLQEYDTGWMETDEAYSIWVDEVHAVTAEVFAIPLEHVALKIRKRMKGLAQYEKAEGAGEFFVVEENGLKFEVNLEAYLDTGLFLDHRNTRKRVMLEAKGKRFLNLFSYTGAFSVYAAAGGAATTTTVDLSNTYLDWAGRNFVLNGFDSVQHQRIRADVFEFLREATCSPQKYDLIVMDPPSFSNSKKMLGVLDVQRDHAYLIESCMAMLAPGGVLYFSNNLRSFELDPMFVGISENLTASSIPEDFRNKRIHQCFRFVKK